MFPRSLIITGVSSRRDERGAQWFSSRKLQSGSSALIVWESPKITIENLALVRATFNLLALAKKPTLNSSLLLRMTD